MKIQIAAEKLRAHFKARAAFHDEKSKIARDRTIVSARQDMLDKQTKVEAARFAFLADHVPDGMIELDATTELITFELVPTEDDIVLDTEPTAPRELFEKPKSLITRVHMAPGRKVQ